MMGFFSKLLFVLLAMFLLWQVYHYIRVNPQAFSKESLGRSFFTLGILALLLIGFIAVLVMMVRH